MAVRAKFGAFLAGLVFLTSASAAGYAQPFAQPAVGRTEKPLKVTIYPRSRLKKPIYIDGGFIETSDGRILYWNGWYIPEGTLTKGQSPVRNDIAGAVVRAVAAVAPKIFDPASPERLLEPLEGWVFGPRYAGQSWPRLLAAFDVSYIQPADAFERRGIYGSPARNKLESGADVHGARLVLADPQGAADFRRAPDIHGIKRD